MCAHRKPLGNRPEKDLLTEILDFGPDQPAEAAPDLSERIRKVKAKIEEINERIARLALRTG